MIRFLSYLFLLLFTLSVGNLCAQTADTAPHKHRFIELVNRGEFNQAVQELPLVEKWTLDIQNEGDDIDVEKALHFGTLLDSIQVVKADRDSFLLYLVDQIASYAYSSYKSSNYLL